VPLGGKALKEEREGCTSDEDFFEIVLVEIRYNSFLSYFLELGIEQFPGRSP
jgi:hypothetical protein